MLSTRRIVRLRVSVYGKMTHLLLFCINFSDCQSENGTDGELRRGGAGAQASQDLQEPGKVNEEIKSFSE